MKEHIDQVKQATEKKRNPKEKDKMKKPSRGAKPGLDEFVEVIERRRSKKRVPPEKEASRGRKTPEKEAPRERSTSPDIGSVADKPFKEMPTKEQSSDERRGNKAREWSKERRKGRERRERERSREGRDRKADKPTRPTREKQTAKK